MQSYYSIIIFIAQRKLPTSLMVSSFGYFSLSLNLDQITSEFIGKLEYFNSFKLS